MTSDESIEILLTMIKFSGKVYLKCAAVESF